MKGGTQASEAMDTSSPRVPLASEGGAKTEDHVTHVKGEKSSPDVEQKTEATASSSSAAGGGGGRGGVSSLQLPPSEGNVATASAAGLAAAAVKAKVREMDWKKGVRRETDCCVSV